LANGLLERSTLLLGLAFALLALSKNMLTLRLKLCSYLEVAGELGAPTEPKAVVKLEAAPKIKPWFDRGGTKLSTVRSGGT